MTPETPRLFFPHINLLRAFAALSVVVYHVIVIFPWEGYPITGPLLWFRTGWMGVDLFFVISGFVIMLSAVQIYGKSENTKEARRIFFRRRAARIMPLYLLTGLAFVIAVEPWMIHEPDFATILITFLTFTQNLFISTHGVINGPSWSVAAEFQFYLLILLLMPWLARIRLSWMLVIGVTIAWATRGAVFAAAEIRDWPIVVRFILSTEVPGMLDEFALGMVLGRLVVDRQLQALTRWHDALRSTKFWMTGILSLATLLIAFSIYWDTPNALFWPFAHMSIPWRTLLASGFMLLIAWLILLPAGCWTQSRLYRAAFYLGEISYGIYLWHMPVLMVLKAQEFTTNPLHFLALTLAVVLVLSALSWHLVEKPLIRRFR